MALTANRILLSAALLAILGTQGCDRGSRARRKPLPPNEQPGAGAPLATSTELVVGDVAPVFSGIIGIDDKRHGLADYKDAKLVVLVFTCNHCPVAQAYEDRLAALQKDYQPKGVQVVAVNVNNLPDDRLDKMKERAKQKDFNFPYLYDPTQKIGHDYGATVTPHVFVLDRDRKLAYMGAIDDSQQAGAVAKHHLRDALDALLIGKRPPKEVTQQFGCGIKYE
jgi:peroxiredoxin